MARVAQIAVVGAGPAGLASALALHELGCAVVLVAPAYDPARAAKDTRTTALLSLSVTLLENLGVWKLCRHAAAPLASIRIIDDRKGLLRAPEVLFRASELGLADFGANIANPALVAALNEAAKAALGLEHLATRAVTCVTPGDAAVRLELAEGGSLEATLVVAADGRNSLVREGAGIGVDAWQYPQSAVAAVFQHSLDHKGVTTELHRRTGPLTTVPLAHNTSSLVWVEEPSEAQRLGALPDQEFAEALEEQLQGLLGCISCGSPRVVFPLAGLKADCMGQNRTALVGEAAHVIPPIGAQGLNLGLRDACVLAECVADACQLGSDIGAPEVLQSYHQARQADVVTRTLAVDAFNRSLIADLLPVQALRGAGLHLLANSSWLRRLLMERGMSPVGPLPRLMRTAAPA
ncbi:MAG TPA: FAD-dependent monooxygenase [Hyphomicrobiaceae bacterium]|nr:FAD-dependent monooxygenase [Hyphomicrobiaceae bacterium]